MNVTSKIELNEDGFGTFNPEVIAMLLNSIRDFFASVGVESMKPMRNQGNRNFQTFRQELSYTHYTPIYTIYSLRNCYLNVA